MRNFLLALFLLAPTLTGAVAPAIQPTEATSRSTLQAPSLNHVYIVLDQATFDAIRDSRELAALLGRTDGGLPDYAPPPPDSDRIFFRGRTTYLELFAPRNRFGEPVGKVGLALGHDQPRHFEELATAWKEMCGSSFRRSSVAYSRRQPPVPWYDSIQCDGTADGPHLAVWGMVYRPEFYRWQSGDAEAAAPRTARADIQKSRMVGGQGRFDIRELTIGVSADIYPALISQLESAGLPRKGSIFAGSGWRLEVRKVQSAELISIRLSTEPSPVRISRLGAFQVKQEDGTSLLLFARKPAKD